MKRLLIALLIVAPLAEASGREGERNNIRAFTVFGGAAVSNYSKREFFPAARSRAWLLIAGIRFQLKAT